MPSTKWLWLCLMILAADEVAAQPREPIGPFVLDARGTLARFKEDSALASSLDVAPSNLPTRGLGLAVGVHWYALRRRLVSFGVGGELVVARGARTGEQTDDALEPPTVKTRFSSVSPQLSINFGRRDGWSYVSGGIGRARLTAERDDDPLPGGAERTQAINYGGGARWFTGPHLAFSVDLRFYTVSARPASVTRPGVPRSRMMVISAGVSMR
jgi:hypothetical protein